MPAKTAAISQSVNIISEDIKSVSGRSGRTAAKSSVPAKAAFGKEDVIACLSAIISADVCACYELSDGNVSVKELKKIPPASRFAVSSIKNGTAGRGPEIQFYDKLKALDMLCKCLGIYSPENDDSEVMSKLDDVLENLM